MKQGFFITLILIMLSCSIYAQDEKAKLKLEGFQFHISNTLSPGISYTTEDFVKLNPNSTLLNNIPSEFEAQSPYIPIENVGFQALQEFRIHKKDKSQSSSLYRIGIEYSISSDFNAGIRNEQLFRIDSFGNSQFRSVVVDSSNTQFYSSYQTSKQLGLHFSFVTNSNLGKKLNMYAGLGGRLGLTFARKNWISQFSFISLDSVKIDHTGNNVSDNPQFNLGNSDDEHLSYENQVNAALFVPLGFNYQISTDHPSWRRVFVGYEVRTTALFSKHPYFGKPNFFHIQHGVNIVYKI